MDTLTPLNVFVAQTLKLRNNTCVDVTALTSGSRFGFCALGGFRQLAVTSGVQKAKSAFLFSASSHRQHLNY